MMDVLTHQRPAVIQFMFNKKLFLLEESDFFFFFIISETSLKSFCLLLPASLVWIYKNRIKMDFAVIYFFFSYPCFTQSPFTLLRPDVLLGAPSPKEPPGQAEGRARPGRLEPVSADVDVKQNTVVVCSLCSLGAWPWFCWICFIVKRKKKSGKQ